MGLLDDALLFAKSVKECFKPGMDLTLQYLIRLGAIYRSKGDLDQASTHYNKVLNSLDKKSQRDIEWGKVHYNLGLIYWQRGDIQSSIEEVMTAHKLFQIENDLVLQSASFNMLGLLHEDLENNELMYQYYHQALKLKEQLGNPHQIAITLFNLGLAYLRQNETDKTKGILIKLQSLDENHENLEVHLRSRLLEAAILGSTKTLRNLAASIEIYETLVNESHFNSELNLDCSFRLLTHLVKEYEITEDEDIYTEIHELLGNMKSKANENKMFSTLVRILHLLAKLNFIQGKFEDTNLLLHQADLICHERKYVRLGKEITNELENIEHTMNQIIEMIYSQKTIADRIHKIDLIDYLNDIKRITPH